MQKKLLAVAISAAMAAPMFATADTTIHGDARVRYSQSTMDVAGTETKNDSTNSRLRIGIESKLDGVTVKGRLKMTDAKHGSNVGSVSATDTNTATACADTDASGDFDACTETTTSKTSKINGVAVDYGYMVVPVGPITVAGGVMVGNFGNRLTYWDTRPNRVALSAKLGSDWKGTLTFDKKKEGGYSDDEDASSTKIILAGKVPMGNVGVMLNSEKTGKNVGDASGSETIISFTGKLPADINLMVEYNTRSGEIFEDVDGDGGNAMYIHAIKKFGNVTGHLAYASAANGFKADDHFAPFATIGKSQDTAMGDFGGVKSASIIAVMAGMNVMPNMNVRAGYGMYDEETTDGGAEGKGTAVDLQATYKVTKKTKIVGVYSTFSTDKDLGDMTYSVTGIRMETKI